MGAKEAIEGSFKNLVMRHPYTKITVAEICRDAHLSRKTFYVNFQGKEDVVASIFERGAVEPIRTLNATLTREQARSISIMYTENLYGYFESEKDYYQKLVGPMFGQDDTFIRVVTRSLYALNQEVLGQLHKGTDLEREYVSYFFAASQAMFCQKWIADGMPISPKQLAELYRSMAYSYWFDAYGSLED